MGASRIIVPRREPRPPHPERVDIAKLDPAQRRRQRDFADGRQSVEFDFLLDEVASSGDLLQLRVPHRRPANLLRPPHCFPAHGNAGIGDPLGERLQPQSQPARAAIFRDKLLALMQAVEEFADHAGIENGKATVADKHRHLAERIQRDHLVVRARRAGLLVEDFQFFGEPDFMCRDENLAGIWRMRLIEEFHDPAIHFDDASMMSGISQHMRPGQPKRPIQMFTVATKNRGFRPGFFRIGSVGCEASLAPLI